MRASRGALLGWAALVAALAIAAPAPAAAQTSDAFAGGWLDLLQEHFPTELSECDWAALKTDEVVKQLGTCQRDMELPLANLTDPKTLEYVCPEPCIETIDNFGALCMFEIKSLFVNETSGWVAALEAGEALPPNVESFSSSLYDLYISELLGAAAGGSMGWATLDTAGKVSAMRLNEATEQEFVEVCLS